MQDALIMSLKLVMAGVFGGIVGYEREVHEHPAGLRTHILVCMGSTLMTIVSMSFQPPASDPSRIAAQIVSGIGFLGAGTILRQGSVVKGLTTAASLWTVAGIGIAVGVGGKDGIFYIISAVATLVVFLTLSLLSRFEPGMSKRSARRLRFETSGEGGAVLGLVMQTLLNLGAEIQTVHGVESHTQGCTAYRLKVVLPRKLGPESMLEVFAGLKAIDRFDWT